MEWVYFMSNIIIFKIGLIGLGSHVLSASSVLFPIINVRNRDKQNCEGSNVQRFEVLHVHWIYWNQSFAIFSAAEL